MGAQTQYQDKIVGELIDYFHTNYKYLSFSATHALPAESATILPGAVQISSLYYNKERESSSYSTTNKSVQLFDINTSEPVTQPIAIGSLGINSSDANSGDIMAVSAKLNATTTKDSNVRNRVRFTLKLLRVDEL